jgi:trans-aconitate methyltransferase
MKKALCYALAFSSLSIFAVSEDYWKAEDYYQNSSSQKQAAADLLKYVTIPEKGSILDVGCGDGKITAELAAAIPQGLVIGVDISLAMIEFAKAHFSSSPNVSFHLRDAQKLDFQNAFDIVFSFTTLQWIQNHDAFLQGAYLSLKPRGTLAVTMPMGLPHTLDQAVHEMINKPEWASYFQNFSTGWNFVTDTDYEERLLAHHFTIQRLAVVPQKDVFPSREIFERFISQWFPYLRPLPESLQKNFLTQVIDRYLALETSFPNKEIHFKVRRLEVIAYKENSQIPEP